MCKPIRISLPGTLLVLLLGSISAAQAGEKTSVTLDITRPKHEFGSLEGLTIYMDGSFVAKIYNDETKQVKLNDVAIGTHKFALYLDILNLGSVEICELLRPKGDNLVRSADIPKDGVIAIRTELKDDKDTDFSLAKGCNWYFSVAVVKPSELLGIHLDREEEEKELASELLETPEGVEQEYEISRTLVRTVTFGETTSLELTGKLDLKTVSGEVCKKWEQEVKQSFKQSETIRRNLKIDGSKTPKLQVVWVGVFRKGTVDFSTNGERKTLPFSIQVALKPQLKVIRD